MHHHRSPDDARGDRPPSADTAERLLLLELVSYPPAEGDSPARLAAALDLDTIQLDRAADALTAIGLAVRDGDVLRASPAALRFEALWPICI